MPWKAVLKKRLSIRRVVCSRGHSVIALLLTLPCGPANACYICHVEMFYSSLEHKLSNQVLLKGSYHRFLLLQCYGATHSCEFRRLEHRTSMRRGRSQLSSTSWAYLWKGRWSHSLECSETLTMPWTAKFTSSVVVKGGYCLGSLWTQRDWAAALRVSRSKLLCNLWNAAFDCYQTNNAGKEAW